jgi:DNA-binding LacI/PurR family transcriptional regulator
MSDDHDRAASAAPGNAGGPGKSPTIYDVARLAGVSHQTVSRHLRGLDGIRPATRERVTRALETLDYRPNLTARNLATRRSHRVGALTHEIGQVGPSKILQGASAGAREAGYLLDIVSLDVEDPAAVQQAVNLITQQDIAGLLVFTSTDAMTEVLRTASIRVPTVIDIEDDERLLDPLMIPSDRGLGTVVDHLVSLGHRRFFHIAGPQGWVSARNRELSYERALHAHALTSLGTSYGDWSAGSGYECARRIPRELGVTAVVVSNDQMALGALLALERLGIRVPQDMSVTGFDDTPESAFYHPPLTTVEADFDRTGRAAFQRLQSLIEGGSAPRRTDSPVRLVVRESSGPTPA